MNKHLMILIAMTSLLALALGCPAGDDDDDAEFEAGQFQFSTVGVTDACTDGALEVIYMPEGSTVPSDWQYAIELPAFDSLPAQVDIQLQDPFQNITVTMDSPGADQFSIAGEPMNGTDLDPDTYADCVVDYTIDALITLSDNDNATGTVTMGTGNWTGADCPVVDSDPCDITLDIEAVRL